MPKSIDGIFPSEVEGLFNSSPGLMDYIGTGCPEKLSRFQQERGYQLKSGESPNDDCLYFLLQKIPAEDVNLPTETPGGFRVFYTGYTKVKKIELP